MQQLKIDSALDLPSRGNEDMLLTSTCADQQSHTAHWLATSTYLHDVDEVVVLLQGVRGKVRVLH